MIFLCYFLIKIVKRGLIYRRTVELMWRARLTWRIGPARMRRGTQGHVAEPSRPTRCAGGAGGADTWQEATRVYADGRVGRHVARGLACEGRTGLWALVRVLGQ